MILTLNPEKIISNDHVERVSTPAIFLGKSLSFHPDGLFSEDVFGIEGSQERRGTLGYIQLNCNVIHPVIYDIINKKISRNFDKFLTGEVLYSMDENGILQKDETGDIFGMSSLVKNIDKIRFRKTGTGEDRDKLVDMIYSNIKSGTFFMDKLLVISPDYRPISVGDNQRDVMLDEMNSLYQRIINLSYQVSGVAGTMYDVLSYNMQRLVMDIFEYVKVKVAKKQGLIRNLMLGKRVDFSARAVIAPDPTLKIGEANIPLPMACSIFSPHILYGLANSPESKNIPDEFHVAVKEFLGKEMNIDELQ